MSDTSAAFGYRPPIAMPNWRGPNQELMKTTRSKALLIKQNQGRSFAEIRREIRNNVKRLISRCWLDVKSIWGTRIGSGILDELKSNTNKKSKLCETIQSILGMKHCLHTSLTPLRILEIRGLACFMKMKEVEKNKKGSSRCEQPQNGSCIF